MALTFKSFSNFSCYFKKYAKDKKHLEFRIKMNDEFLSIFYDSRYLLTFNLPQK